MSAAPWETTAGRFAAGDAVKVRGLRGSFRFRSARVESVGMVATLWGGPIGHEQYRAVPIDRLTKRRG